MANILPIFEKKKILLALIFLWTVFLISSCSILKGGKQPIQRITQPSSVSESPSSTWTSTPAPLININPPHASNPTEATLASLSSMAIPLFTSTVSIQPLNCLPLSTAENFGIVRWVESGDTIVVDISGRLQTVKYLGVDAAHAQSDIQFYGPPAATQNSVLVNGQVVRMIPDGEDRDEYGQLRRYVVVYNTNTFANYDILRAGLAKVPSDSTSLTCYSTFIMAEEYARNDQIGLWRPLQTSQPTITKEPTSRPIPSTILTPSPTSELTPSSTMSPTPTLTSTVQTATTTSTSTSTPTTPSPTLTHTPENTETPTP